MSVPAVPGHVKQEKSVSTQEVVRSANVLMVTDACWAHAQVSSQTM